MCRRHLRWSDRNDGPARRRMRIGALKPATIQGGPPFAGHLQSWQCILVAGMTALYLEDIWKFAAQGQSRAIAQSDSSLPHYAQQAHSLQQRYAMRRGFPADQDAPALTQARHRPALAMPSLPMTVLHHNGPQRNEHTPSLLALRRVPDRSGSGV